MTGRRQHNTGRAHDEAGTNRRGIPADRGGPEPRKRVPEGLRPQPEPLRGCSFGCTYCYAAFFQRTKAQQDTWGEWVTVKENAPDLIAGLPAGKLDGKRIYMSSVTDPYQPVERKSLKRIYMSSVTDPYQPVERKSLMGNTRRILELMTQRHAPRLVVQTRSPLVTRDIDLFGKIEERGGRVQVNMTVTTDDEDVRKTF